MEHWTRNCLCLVKAPEVNNAAAAAESDEEIQIVPPALASVAPKNNLPDRGQKFVTPPSSPKENVAEAQKFVTPPSSPIAGPSILILSSILFFYLIFIHNFIFLGTGVNKSTTHITISYPGN